MQDDTRSRAPISDRQLIGVSRISMLSAAIPMTCTFKLTFTITTPAGNKSYSDYKTGYPDSNRGLGQVGWQVLAAVGASRCRVVARAGVVAAA